MLIALMTGYEFSLSPCCSISCLICFFLTNISAILGVSVQTLTFEMIDACSKIKPNNSVWWKCCLAHCSVLNDWSPLLPLLLNCYESGKYLLPELPQPLQKNYQQTSQYYFHSTGWLFQHSFHSFFVKINNYDEICFW
jgi:hypothetical protein